MMDGCTGGRRDAGASGSRGNWQARLGFCFLLTAHSHITSSDVGRSNLSSASSPSPSFPLPPLAFESFSSWVQFCSYRVRVSVCMVMSMSVLRGCAHARVSLCVRSGYSHIHTCGSPRTLTNSLWKSVASPSIRTSGSGHFAVGSRRTLT